VPKRVLDFEAMWASDKLAACAAWAQAEYAWLYGLADANGSFELTNLRVIWGRVAAIRENLSLERLEQVFAEFHDKGLLFVWEENGKKYGHWTNCKKTGRLPRASRRSSRYEKVFAPPVPEASYRAYLSRFHGDATRMASHGDAGASLAEATAMATATDSEEQAAREQGPASTEKPGTERPAFAYQGPCLQIALRQDAALAEAFPWVERQAEYRKMNSWLEANPLRRPKNASRFAHNWFSKIPPPSSGVYPEPFGSAQGRVGRGAPDKPGSAALPQARAGSGPSLGSGRVKPEYLERLRQREQAQAGPTRKAIPGV